MPLFADYHTHPQGHRVQPYTQALLQPWVDQARKIGLRELAFTDHDRYHAGIDFDEIERLREKNPDIQIRAGLELDNGPQTSAAGRAWVERHWDKLDFVLGSVHYLDIPNEMFDSVPEGVGQFKDRDIDAIYTDYFRRVRTMAETGLIDCLAHFDLVKIHGHRPNTGVTELCNETLDFIRLKNLSLELSTAGWRKPVQELYPSDDIIRMAQQKEMNFTVASDAHSHVQLGDRYQALQEKIISLGIRQIAGFTRHQRSLVLIEDAAPNAGSV